MKTRSWEAIGQEDWMRGDDGVAKDLGDGDEEKQMDQRETECGVNRTWY